MKSILAMNLGRFPVGVVNEGKTNSAEEWDMEFDFPAMLGNTWLKSANALKLETSDIIWF